METTNYLKILQNVGIYSNEDYYNFLETIIKNGNKIILVSVYDYYPVPSRFTAPGRSRGRSPGGGFGRGIRRRPGPCRSGLWRGGCAPRCIP